MKKLTKSFVALFLSATALAGCDILNKDEEKKEEEKPIIDDDIPQTVKSGKIIELDGVGYTYASGSKDGEIIHIEEASGKTKVYGISGGVATLTKDGKNYPITVNLDVALISAGSSYSAYATRAAEYTLVQTPDKFTVGNKNKFFPHFELVCNSFSNQGSGWEEDDLNVDLLNVGAYVDSASKPQITVNSALADVNADFSLSFKDAALNQDVALSIKVGTQAPVEMSVFVKEGYNAHSHEEFKSLVEDTKIGGQINVLRNIKSELSRDRFFEDDQQPAAPDGTHFYPNNIYEDAHTKTTTGSVYNRVFDAGETILPISVNGNFLELDTRSVPDHVPSVKAGQRTPIGQIPNNGEGVFFIKKPVADTVVDLSLNNIKITGNSDRGTIGAETAGCYGLAGIVSHRAGLAINNSKIDHVERGTFMIDQAFVDAKNTYIADVWGGGLTGYYANHLTMQHCTAERLGGPIFWPMGNRERENGLGQTSVSWDKTCVLNNWMSANSSWCQANGMSDLGSGLDMIEDTIGAGGITIYGANKTFNFIYLAMNNQSDMNYPVTVFNNVKVKDESGADLFVANESPDDIQSLPDVVPGSVEHPVKTIANTVYGNYICGVGQSYNDMMNGMLPMIQGGAAPFDAYAATLGQQLGAQFTQLSNHAYLNISYNLGSVMAGAGFCTAFCEVLPKA